MNWQGRRQSTSIDDRRGVNPLHDIMSSVQRFKGMYSPYLTQPQPMNQVQMRPDTRTTNPAHHYQTITPPTDEEIYDRYLGVPPQMERGYASGGMVAQINPFDTYVSALKSFGQIPQNPEHRPGGPLMRAPSLPGYLPLQGLASLVPPGAGDPLDVRNFATGGYVYPSRQEIIDFIRRRAQAYGIDPDIAVQVARSEGLNADPREAWQSRVVNNGVREPSYHPFQLHKQYMGGEFERSTGLRLEDPANWQSATDYALQRASQGGWSPWYGAKAVGISPWQGINSGGARMAASTYADPTAAATGAAAAANVAAQQAATEQAAAAASPSSSGLMSLAMMLMGGGPKPQPMNTEVHQMRPREPIDPERETEMTSQTPDWYRKRRRYYA